VGELGLEARADRGLLAARLRERLPEIEAAIATRVHAISDPREVPDPRYVQGLDAALPAAIAYALAALEQGERQVPEIPSALLAQARLAARNRVALDTLMRQCFAANALFADYLAAEAERAGVPAAAARRLQASQASHFDRLLAAVGEEYAREARSRPAGAAERRRECVKRLLAGELADSSELGYELEAQHLGLIAKGEGGQELMRALAPRLDRNLLAVKREEEAIWACWLGGRRPLAAGEAAAALTELVPDGMVVTVGEPAAGLSGWRWSHRQAKAALPIAEGSGATVLRYAEVAVLASVLADELSADSLRQLYMAPLERARDGGEAARATLRAYLAAAGSITSTAAALGVDRRTVRNRLRRIEELLGATVPAVASDLEIALQLDELRRDR
jgi:PucR-like helix-turn-helix protein/diguanylate cyclase with GGDEF domain